MRDQGPEARQAWIGGEAEQQPPGRISSVLLGIIKWSLHRGQGRA